VRESDTTDRYEILGLEPARFAASLEQLVAVYAAAMEAPAELLAGRQMIMSGHVTQPGFQAYAAVREDHIRGFCYGFHGATGQWWHDWVSFGLAGAHGQAVAKEWLTDSLEIAELHVMPEDHGRGIGTALLAHLTDGRPERTAVLSTRDTESAARRLYRKAGFTDLLTDFTFDSAESAYAIMGASLPLRLPRASSPSS
jgi:ribosomal protein S18 acetylase RimI-like enzyme